MTTKDTTITLLLAAIAVAAVLFLLKSKNKSTSLPASSTLEETQAVLPPIVEDSQGNVDIDQELENIDDLLDEIESEAPAADELDDESLGL